MFQSPAIITEEGLIRGLSAGCRDAFTIIYERYWYKLYLIAYRRLGSKEISEELVQDLFVQLWEGRAAMGTVTRLENYLVSGMKNRVIDHVRSRIVQDKYIEYYRYYNRHESEQTEENIAFNELNLLISKSLELLPETSRETYRLRWIEHWPVSRIARHLKLSEKAVEYHLTKSLKFLRTRLKDFTASVLLLAALLFS